MRTFGHLMRMLQKNWKILLGFELLYKLVSFTISIPLFGQLFYGIMRLNGYGYITIDNVFEFASSPFTIILVLLWLFLLAAYSMLDISAVLFILDQSGQKKKVTLLQTIKFSVMNAARMFRSGNVRLILMLLFIIPFLNIGAASGFVTTFSIPEFILEYVHSHPWILIAFTALALVCLFFLLRWLYVFPYFTLEKCSFREAVKKSVALGKMHRAVDFAFLIVIQVFYYLIYFLFVSLGLKAVYSISTALSGLSFIKIVSASALWLFLLFAQLLVVALGTPFSYACISIHYFRRKMECGEKIIHTTAPEYERSRRMKRRLLIAQLAVALLSLMGASFMVYGFNTGKLKLQVEYLHATEVTAHRGASAIYPENTMAAFHGAVDQDADWIELDIQQSADGEIFVMHDTNLKRTAGINRNTWEMTWEELSQADVGSFFGSEFAGERIPLLSEVIDFAKENNVRLNIEIKPTGHETDFEQSVVDLIREKNFEDYCVVTSQNYSVLERVKEYDEDIKTVYVMSLAYGNMNFFTAADAFSVESSNVTASLVSRVHNAGKEIYAWTVNTKNSINKMIDRNVDNIITDRVPLARQCIFDSDTSDLITEYVNFIRKH